MKITDNYVFFWKGNFNNWFPSKFIWKNIQFNCAEQAMMWYKALMFADGFTAQQILDTDNPKLQKQLGRNVKNYDDEKWNKVRLNIVADILYAKFSQNKELRQMLLNTEGKIIVEASPFDNIWGIGLTEDDPDCLDESKWKGQNLLGKALMLAREKLNSR